jgi:hypothetical protein
VDEKGYDFLNLRLAVDENRHPLYGQIRCKGARISLCSRIGCSVYR